jgi:hypothetical protein
MPKEEGAVLMLTQQQLQEIIVNAIREGKKPDEETAAKMAEEKARKEANRVAMLELAKTEIEGKLNREARCSHTRPEDGKRMIGGQVHSDGMIHPLCLRCGKEFAAYPAPKDLFSGATGL